MKTLLFIGGTAFFGRLAVQQLVRSRQYHVTVLTRGHQLPAEFNTGISRIRCDRTDPAALQTALRGQAFDVVVDNIPSNGADVRALMAALPGRIGHYLLCSTAMVYPEWHTSHAWSEPEASLWPIPGQSSYANDKREAERQLMELGTVPYTIYRPTVVQGPADPVHRTRYFVEKILRQESFCLPDDVLLQHVYSADVAEALVRLIAAGPAHRAFNICGREQIPLADYCARIAVVLQRPNCHKLVSRAEWQSASRAGFPGLYDQSLLLTNTALVERTGFQPTPIQEWLLVTVRWNLEPAR